MKGLEVQPEVLERDRSVVTSESERGLLRPAGSSHWTLDVGRFLPFWSSRTFSLAQFSLDTLCGGVGVGISVTRPDVVTDFVSVEILNVVYNVCSQP